MLRTTSILLAAAASLVLAACTRVDVTTAASEEITFTAGGFSAGVVSTKTSEVTSLSSFNVLAVTGTMGVSETTVFNVPFNGTTAYTGGKFWPSSDQSYKFYASNMGLTASPTGPTVAASNATDVVCAVLASPVYKSSNALTFEHIFARVGFCNVTPPAGFSVSNIAVKLTPKVSGVYDLFAGNGRDDGTGWSVLSSGPEVTLTTATGSTADCGLYLVPGSYVLTATYTLTKGDWSKSLTKHATVPLKAGRVNNITTTLASEDVSDMSVSVTLNPWMDNDISIDSWS